MKNALLTVVHVKKKKQTKLEGFGSRSCPILKSNYSNGKISSKHESLEKYHSVSVYLLGSNVVYVYI